MLPPDACGTVTWLAPSGSYAVTDVLVEIEFGGHKTKHTMLQVHNNNSLSRSLYSCHSFHVTLL